MNFNEQHDRLERQAEMVLANIRNAVANGEFVSAEEERKTYNVIRRKLNEIERMMVDDE